MIIDSHAHIGLFGNKDWKPDDLINSMDEAGIDLSLVIANKFEDIGITTEEAIEINKKHPRLIPIGYAETENADIEKLIDNLERNLIHGVKFYPGYNNYYPQDEKFQKIYKYCQKANKPVIFHTGLMASGFRGLLKQTHPLNIDEVANEYPDLKIIMAHFGNPWIVDCTAVAFKNPNVYIDLSGYFEEYSSISQKDIEGFVQDLMFFRNYIGDFKKCLFGTDWPLYSQKEYLEAVRHLPMTDEEKELVFSKNAATLFNLSV